MVRAVAVRSEQGGAAAAEGAVGVDLDAGELVAALRGDRVGGAGVELAGEPLLVGVAVHAEVELAAGGELAEDGVGGGVDAHLVYAGEAAGEHVGLGGEELAAEIGGGGDRGGQKGHGAVDEHAGGVAAIVAEQLSSRGIRGAVIDPGERERGLVGPAGVAVDPDQPDRSIGEGFAEGAVIGHGGVAPAVLIPAAAEHPAGRGGAGAQAREQLGDPGGVAEVDDLEVAAEADEVGVGVGEAGQGAAAVEIEHAGVRAAGGFDEGAIADAEDPTVRDRERFGFGAPGIHGEHAAAEDQEIGGASLGGGAVVRGGLAALAGGDGEGCEGLAEAATVEREGGHGRTVAGRARRLSGAARSVDGRGRLGDDCPVDPRAALKIVAAVLAAALGCADQRSSPPPPPAIALAQVAEASPSTRTPIATLTLTREEVVVEVALANQDASRADLPAIERFPLDEGSALQGQLARIFDRAGLADATDLLDGPRLRIRVAADVRHEEWIAAMIPIGRAGFGAVELEVNSPAGVGHWTLRPYTFCACLPPPVRSWCASPSVTIFADGVDLHAEADLTPPPGCHKALKRHGEVDPPVTGAEYWRDRTIAGPAGGCPSAAIDERGLDLEALRARLRALHQAAPSCGRASVAIPDQTPWSTSAAVLAAIYAEYGEVPTSFLPERDAVSRAARCGDALSIEALAPGQASSPLIGRRGCSE